MSGLFIKLKNSRIDVREEKIDEIEEAEKESNQI